jgi:hypothetical protein
MTVRRKYSNFRWVYLTARKYSLSPDQSLQKQHQRPQEPLTAGRLIAKLRLPGVVRSERQHRNICSRIKLVASIIKSAGRAAVRTDLSIFMEASQAVTQPQTSLFVLYVTTTVTQAETRCV